MKIAELRDKVKKYIEDAMPAIKAAVLAYFTTVTSNLLVKILAVIEAALTHKLFKLLLERFHALKEKVAETLQPGPAPLYPKSIKLLRHSNIESLKRPSQAE